MEEDKKSPIEPVPEKGEERGTRNEERETGDGKGKGPGQSIIEPIPETEHSKKRRKEEEYFRKEDAEKIKRLHEKLTAQIQTQAEPKPVGNLARKNRMKLAEAILALLIALGLTRLILLIKSGPVAGYVDLILAGIWLYLPAIFIWVRKESLIDFAITRLNLGKGLLWLILASLLIFPTFYLISYLGATKFLDYQFVLTIPKNFLSLAISQLLLISLPEEWFFRGYLQGRFNQVFGKKWKFLSAQIGPGLFLATILFALAHFTFRPFPDRLLVFFPALAFGWLREKTDSLLAPVLFHFLANLSFIIFQVSLIK